MTEEVIFRSAIVPLHILAKVPPGRIVFTAPLYFGVAHIHHFYEFCTTHPDTSVIVALLRSLFQFTYTTMFGWYATFIYLRTGSLVSVILVHSFCNWCGVPRLWGRVEGDVSYTAPIARGKEDDGTTPEAQGQLDIGWTVAYYVLLFAGLIGFCYTLWPFTQSSHGLVTFYAGVK